jgi:hypothetical protein
MLKPIFLATWEAEMGGGSRCKASPSKKFTRPHPKQWLGMTHLSSQAIHGNANKRILVQASLDIKQDFISTITNTKRVLKW